MERKAFMCDMILTELEDVVGVENVSTSKSDRAAYGVDYFWIGRMWVDRGEKPPMPDWIVRPGSSVEVSKILKIANYYKIPVNIWGGGSGSQGGALPMAGGIMMDMKRMNHLIEMDEVSRTITAEAGMIFQQLEWYANERGYSCQHIPSCLTCGTIGTMLTFVVTGPIVEHSGPQAALLTANGLYAVVFVMCFLLGFVSRHRQHNTLTSH